MRVCDIDGGAEGVRTFELGEPREEFPPTLAGVIASEGPQPEVAWLPSIDVCVECAAVLRDEGTVRGIRLRAKGRIK